MSRTRTFLSRNIVPGLRLRERDFSKKAPVRRHSGVIKDTDSVLPLETPDYLESPEELNPSDKLLTPAEELFQRQVGNPPFTSPCLLILGGLTSSERISKKSNCAIPVDHG